VNIQRWRNIQGYNHQLIGPVRHHTRIKRGHKFHLKMLNSRTSQSSGLIETNIMRLLLISLAVLLGGLNLVQSDDEHHIERRWADFPNVTFTFNCTDRPIGFYADLELDCMIFHLCDEDGRRIPYMCGNGTSFNQKFRVCDWNYNVDCQESPEWYYLNDLTYRTDPPKTEDPSSYN